MKATIIILISVLLSACSSDNNPNNHSHPNLKTGKQLFDYHCAGCHGKKGLGKFIAGIPPSVLTEKSKRGVLRLMHKGSNTEGSNMPAFKNMPKKEARLIIGHLFKLRKQLMENKSLHFIETF